MNIVSCFGRGEMGTINYALANLDSEREREKERERERERESFMASL